MARTLSTFATGCLIVLAAWFACPAPLFALAPAGPPPGSASAAPTPAQPSLAALDFLKQTMAHYQAMKTFQAKCAWGASYNSTTSAKAAPDDTASRSVWYVKPNFFKIVNTNSNGFVLTTACDGKKLIDYTNTAGGAQSYPAPASFDSATSMQLQMPMFDGSLLYLFFGGPDYLDRLVNQNKGSVAYGLDMTIDSEPCHTVAFYATGTYGNVRIAIGTQDGLVHQVAYDSAPLIAMMREQFKGKPAGNVKSSETTETYQNMVVDQPIAASVFTATLPAGTSMSNMPAPPSEKPPVPIGNMAPNITVKSAAGGAPVSLSSLRGKVILIDFWATWCPPCRKGLPETNKLNLEYRGKGLVVMAVSDEEPATIKKFVAANHYGFTAFRDAGDTAEKAYAIQAIPTDVVIDPKGHLVAYMVGLQDPSDIMAALKKAGFAAGS